MFLFLSTHFSQPDRPSFVLVQPISIKGRNTAPVPACSGHCKVHCTHMAPDLITSHHWDTAPNTHNLREERFQCVSASPKAGQHGAGS